MIIVFFISVVMMLTGYVCGVMMFNVQRNKHAVKSEVVPFVSIIIPARDEAERLPVLLQSLNTQHFTHYEVIVVDDDSQDDTAGVAESFGAEVEKSGPYHDMPPGKARACAIGADRASGEWLLFLDADVCLDTEDSLERFLSLYINYGQRGILSLQPYHAIKQFYENFSAVFNIIVITGMNVFSIWKERFQTAGSFGPVILCDRDSYFKAGGHQSAADSIMDDFALSDLFVSKDIPVHNVISGSLFSLRMYPDGMKGLIEGWTKNLATASASTHPFIMTLVIFWVFSALMSGVPVLAALYIGSPVLIVISLCLYILYGVGMYNMARQAGRFSAWCILIYPLLFIFFIGVYSYSFFRTYVLKSVRWKGRNIKL